VSLKSRSVPAEESVTLSLNALRWLQQQSQKTGDIRRAGKIIGNYACSHILSPHTASVNLRLRAH
jgi:uncharacterized protein YgbK (DUF1537 family)